jgi:hypothetical protein
VNVLYRRKSGDFGLIEPTLAKESLCGRALLGTRESVRYAKPLLALRTAKLSSSCREFGHFCVRS